MIAWIVVALLAVFSADAGVPSLDANGAPIESLDGSGLPPKP
jgi:hypothetical protein